MKSDSLHFLPFRTTLYPIRTIFVKETQLDRNPTVIRWIHRQRFSHIMQWCHRRQDQHLVVLVVSEVFVFLVSLSTRFHYRKVVAESLRPLIMPETNDIWGSIPTRMWQERLVS